MLASPPHLGRRAPKCACSVSMQSLSWCIPKVCPALFSVLDLLIWPVPSSTPITVVSVYSAFGMCREGGNRQEGLCGCSVEVERKKTWTVLLDWELKLLDSVSSPS